MKYCGEVMQNGPIKLWKFSQLLWSGIYLVCGTIHILSGIPLLLSSSSCCVIGLGCLNIVLASIGFLIVSFGSFEKNQREILLYISVSLLMVNTAASIILEYLWYKYKIDLQLPISNIQQLFFYYVWISVRLCTVTNIITAFINCQTAFCSLQIYYSPSNLTIDKSFNSHEQISDIESILPRTKSPKPHCDPDKANLQSWVFERQSSGDNSHSHLNSPPDLLLYIDKKTLPTPKRIIVKAYGDAHIADNPVISLDELSQNENDINYDRGLCCMKSFSRSTTPMIGSRRSSHASLYGYVQPAIVKLPNSEANISVEIIQTETNQLPSLSDKEAVQEQAQHASLMKELKDVISHKKDSPSHQLEADTNDAEFSKELEAALQLIQDLDSPKSINQTEQQQDN